MVDDDADVALVAARIAALSQTDEGMARVMDATFGVGGWQRDEHEDLWVAPDPQHTGPGRRFWCVRRGGSWFEAVLPDAKMQ